MMAQTSCIDHVQSWADVDNSTDDVLHCEVVRFATNAKGREQTYCLPDDDTKATVTGARTTATKGSAKRGPKKCSHMTSSTEESAGDTQMVKKHMTGKGKTVKENRNGQQPATPEPGSLEATTSDGRQPRDMADMSPLGTLMHNGNTGDMKSPVQPVINFISVTPQSSPMKRFDLDLSLANRSLQVPMVDSRHADSPASSVSMLEGDDTEQIVGRMQRGAWVKARSLIEKAKLKAKDSNNHLLKLKLVYLDNHVEKLTIPAVDLGKDSINAVTKMGNYLIAIGHNKHEVALTILTIYKMDLDADDVVYAYWEDILDS